MRFSRIHFLRLCVESLFAQWRTVLMTDRVANPSAPASSFSLAQHFLIATWFALLAGLLEGLSFFILQHTGGLNWQVKLTAVDQNILWASPLTDLVLFLLVAVVSAPVLWLARRTRWQVASMLVFGFLAAYAVLSVSGRMQGYGVLALSLGIAVACGRWAVVDAPAAMARLQRTLPALAGLTLFACVAGAASGWVLERIEISRLPAPPAGAPNVLLIVLDTLRADRVGAYGYAKRVTPFLDEYARQSVLFERAFANSSWTLPSHTSLFTGRLPHEHGATLEPYDGRFPTLADALAGHGYATTGIVANTYFATRLHGMGRGFQHWENIFVSAADSARRTALGRKLEKRLLDRIQLRGQPGRMAAPEITSRFLRWLDARPQRPFFAFLNYIDLHRPFAPPAEYAARFAPEIIKITPPGAWRRRGTAAEIADEAELEKLYSDGYDATLAHLDAVLRNLFAELRKRGLEENLLVIITSDHGESFGEHRVSGHRNSLYLEQLRVPLMVRLPGKTPAGQRVAGVTGLHDVSATIAEIAGLPRAALPGNSLAGCWTGGTCGSGEVVAEVDGGRYPGVEEHWPIYQGWVKSFITSPWQLLLQQDGKAELFNWETDPLGTHNLIESTEGRPIAAGLRARLLARVPEARTAGRAAGGLK